MTADNEELAKRLLVMAELYSKEFSQAAAQMLVSRLSKFPHHDVLAALDLCIDELKFFPSVSEIIDRINTGHPGAEEAWAMLPKNEATTAVLTSVTLEAYGIVYKLMTTDMIAARKAFLEVYSKAMADVRRTGVAPQWQVSLGHDASGREGPVVEAVHKGYISRERATSFLGHDPLGERQTVTYQEITRKLSLMPPINDKEQQ